MYQREKIRFNHLVFVGMALIVLFATWWFKPSHMPYNFHGVWHGLDFILFLILSYIIWHPIIMEMLTWSIARKINNPTVPEPQAGLTVAFITTFVPKSEPYDLLHNILPAMVNAEYPHDTWLLDEGGDPEAKRICDYYGVHYFSRHGIGSYNTDEGQFAAKTKGGNHNAWYDYVGKEYDYVAQIDTDFVPCNDFLTKTLGYFRDPFVAFVGTPQVYGNGHRSFIARGAAEQTYGFYGPIMRGLYGQNMTLMIGANHVVCVNALKTIGYYSAHLTEDLLTGMNLHARGFTSIYIPETLAVGEGPTSWLSYFNQQMRWAHGCISILFTHSLDLTSTMKRRKAFNYFLLQQHYFSGIAMMLGVILLSLYFLLGINVANIGTLSMAVVYLPVIGWLLLVQMWLQRFYVNPESEGGFNFRGMIVSIAAWPVYFLAFVAVLRGKRLTFKVTQKGENLPTRTPIKVFLPHIIIGTITLIDILVSRATGHHALIMLFWAALTTTCMYGIAFHELFLGILLKFTGIFRPLIRAFDRQINYLLSKSSS